MQTNVDSSAFDKRFPCVNSTYHPTMFSFASKTCLRSTAIWMSHAFQYDRHVLWQTFTKTTDKHKFEIPPFVPSLAFLHVSTIMPRIKSLIPVCCHAITVSHAAPANSEDSLQAARTVYLLFSDIRPITGIHRWWRLWDRPVDQSRSLLALRIENWEVRRTHFIAAR